MTGVTDSLAKLHGAFKFSEFLKIVRRKEVCFVERVINQFGMSRIRQRNNRWSPDGPRARGGVQIVHAIEAVWSTSAEELSCLRRESRIHVSDRNYKNLISLPCLNNT